MKGVVRQWSDALHINSQYYYMQTHSVNATSFVDMKITHLTKILMIIGLVELPLPVISF